MSASYHFVDNLAGSMTVNRWDPFHRGYYCVSLFASFGGHGNPKRFCAAEFNLRFVVDDHGDLVKVPQ
jgi:hypothetical protein